MLAIRMQRTGRKGHAQFRLIVQESRRTPSSGNVVAALGSYDPHTKAIILDKEKASTYLNNGAQPSPRVAMLLQKEGVKLPSWVKVDQNRSRAIKHTDKLRRNQTPEPTEEVAAEEAVAEPAAESAAEPTTDTPETTADNEELEEVTEEVTTVVEEIPTTEENPVDEVIINEVTIEEEPEASTEAEADSEAADGAEAKSETKTNTKK